MLSGNLFLWLIPEQFQRTVKVRPRILGSDEKIDNHLATVEIGGIKFVAILLNFLLLDRAPVFRGLQFLPV